MPPTSPNLVPDANPNGRGWRGPLLDTCLWVAAGLGLLWIISSLAFLPETRVHFETYAGLGFVALVWVAALGKGLPEAARLAALSLFNFGLAILALRVTGPTPGPVLLSVLAVLTLALFHGKRGGALALGAVAVIYLLTARGWISGELRSQPEYFPVDMATPRYWLRLGLTQIVATAAIVTSVVYVLDYANRTLARLQKSEEKFSKAFQASPDAIVLTDMETGRYLEVNDSHQRLTGYTRSEILGKTAIDLGAYADMSERQKRVDQLLATGAIRDAELNVRRKDGGTTVARYNAEMIDVAGRPCILSVLRDVTDRVVAERALGESEEKFSKAFHASPNAITITDAETGRFVDVNEGYTRLFGFMRSEVLGRTALEIGMWQDPAARAKLMAQLEEKGSIRDFLIHVKNRNGEPFIMLFSCDRIELGGKLHYVTVGQDITARVEAERALRESEETLRRLNVELEQRVADRTAQLTAANAELESFSYSVSHDLRSPLRAIDGFSKALNEDFAEQLGEEGQDYLRRVRAASQRMGQLIDDLLQLSRAARVEMRREPVNLSELALGIAAELRERQPEPSVDFECASDLVALADPALARIVLENLLHNAWKYTRKKAAPRVELGRVAAHERPGETLFFVRDNGAGFDMRYSTKLFSPFQRLHPTSEFEGTGIGLATVRRITTRHGGRVWAESVVGEGTIVYFSLAGVRV